MGIKVKKKKRSASTSRKARFKGESNRVLEEALDRINPKPTRKTWRPMAEGLADSKGMMPYYESFMDQHGEKLGWEWAALWICHALACDGGDVTFAARVYDVLVAEFPADHLTELSRARLCRNYTGEYFLAKAHFHTARALWPEGYSVHYELGILYDLLGVPEFAFAFAELAHARTDYFGDEAYKHKARVSYNMAVAMWQAARPYGDIKAYLRRALEEWPGYERAERLLAAMPDNDEADPKGRNSMQRLTEDIKKNMNAPSYHVIEPETETDQV